MPKRDVKKLSTRLMPTDRCGPFVKMKIWIVVSYLVNCCVYRTCDMDKTYLSTQMLFFPICLEPNS